MALGDVLAGMATASGVLVTSPDLVDNLRGPVDVLDRSRTEAHMAALHTVNEFFAAGRPRLASRTERARAPRADRDIRKPLKAPGLDPARRAISATCGPCSSRLVVDSMTVTDATKSDIVHQGSGHLQW